MSLSRLKEARQKDSLVRVVRGLQIGILELAQIRCSEKTMVQVPGREPRLKEMAVKVDRRTNRWT